MTVKQLKKIRKRTGLCQSICQLIIFAQNIETQRKRKKERRINDRHELMQCNDDDERHGEGKESEAANNESVEVEKERTRNEAKERNEKRKKQTTWKCSC